MSARPVTSIETPSAAPAKVRRTPRTRARGTAVRLTERDLWLFEALAKMRFVTTSQVATLYFAGSRWSANKRLRRLFDAGLLQVWVRSLSEDNVYALSRKGLRALDERADGEAFDVTLPRGLDGNLAHLLAINQVRIALALGVPEAGGELAWWRSDWDLRARGRERIVPDAFFTIHWAQRGARTYALEVDHHTKSARRFLKKMLAYASSRRQGSGLYGVSDFVVLVAGRDRHWVERYRRGLHTARLGEWIWLTTLEAVEHAGVDAPIWQPAERMRNRSLRDLASFPNGKEGYRYVTN